MTKKDKTSAEQCVEELEDYKGDNPWQDIIYWYGINNKKGDKEDPEASYDIYFKDGSHLHLYPDGWEPEDEYIIKEVKHKKQAKA